MSYIYREQENFLLRSNQQQAESFIQKKKTGKTILNSVNLGGKLPPEDIF